MPNMTQKFGSDPLDYLGGSGFNRAREMGLPEQYDLTPQDHENAFYDVNPQMRPEYTQGQSSWTKRLMQRLAQAGQTQQNAVQQGQPQQQASPQMGGGMDAMQSQGAALQNSYNQGRQMGQAGRGVAEMFGFGR